MSKQLEPLSEYVISDVYLPTMRGSARQRGVLRFRTDSHGNVWVKGAGHREDASLVHWYASHPNLRRVD